MSVITTIIPAQALEIVRDRIGEILADEIDNQAQLTYSEDLELTVYAERFIPFDETELPAINVTLARGVLEGQTAIQSDGTYTYNIDVHTLAKTAAGDPGDSKAMIKLHRLIGMCRAILEDPRYKTLGFVPPFVMNRHVDEIGIADPDPQDASSSVMGRLTFMVRVPENVSLIQPVLIQGYETKVKLYETDKGYIFTQYP